MLNDILHIFTGGWLCFSLIPTAELWIMVLFIGGISGLREHIQSLRIHPQKVYHKYTDTLGWIIGSVIYYFLRKYNYVDPDKNY